jgi:uncharacterized membrane protein YkoI
MIAKKTTDLGHLKMDTQLHTTFERGIKMKNLKDRVIYMVFTVLFFGVSAHSATTKPKLTLEQATAIATKKVAGKVKSSEFEHEMGQDVYSFDIIGKDNAIHEILVNANTGKIVSNKIESAANEAKEAAADEKK